MLKRIVGVLAACMVLFAIPQSASAMVIPNHFSRMLIGANWKCLDADTNTMNTNGGIVQQWQCIGNPADNTTPYNQLWLAVPQNNGSAAYNLVPGGTTGFKCLTTMGGLSYSRVSLWDCNSGTSQAWFPINTNAWVNPITGLCLEADPNQNYNGGGMYIAPCATADGKPVLRQTFGFID
ncbi:ricin-type beta-trefoil lectin domain protein [Embleya sp. NPDC005971]|uniref:RICIN domain-containing protein n=1 Tax=unclassified Embleya TaxID=2699296 RepID=UPI0033D6BD9A